MCICPHQVRDLREKLDGVSESLTKTQTQLRESEERGKEREGEMEKTQSELTEMTARAEELKVNGSFTYICEEPW